MLHSGHPFSAIAATLARRRRPKGEGSGQALPRPCADLGLLGGDEVQTLVKFVNLPSPHPGELSQSSHASPGERVAAGRVRGQLL